LNVLVTSLSRKVPLLAALRRAIDDLPEGGVLWGADSDPGCVGSYFSERFWEMPPLDADGAADEVVEFCSSAEIGLLIPTRDGELAWLAALRERLAAAGTHVSVGGPEAIEVCLDKLAFYEHCRGLGIPTPPTSQRLDDLAGERLVVKGRRGAGAREVGIGLDRAGAGRQAALLDDPIFQVEAEGVEHSIDVYVNRDGEVVDAAPRTRMRVHDGESTVTETVDCPKLVELASRFAESLDLRGHLVIQGFVAGDGGATLLECNPRVGGASTLGFHAGIETPRWALAEAAGQRVAPQMGRYRRGLRMVRYPADRLIEPSP
jgi:carbamoyl-phosphate synthase large subunit